MYCGKDAAAAFEDLVNKLKCKYIILSYNNTDDSVDGRSNARISDEEEERLFVCVVNNGKKSKKVDVIKSPLNYTGGKTKLLPQILPFFSDKIKNINEIINRYDLSKSDINGYEVYGCNSASGLGKYNRERF